MFRPPDVDALAADLWRRHVESCDDCGGTGHLVIETDDPLLSRTRPCECQAEVTLLCTLREANVPREFWTVEGLEFERNTSARARVEEYTGDLRTARRDGGGFLMIGENGVGKTACACVILCRAARAGYSVGYMTSHDFVTSAVAATRDVELEMWRRDLVAADFLVLDEVGKEHRKAGSEFALSELDSLLRWRRGESRPTVICTNFKTAEFAQTYGDSLWSILRDRMEILKFQSGDFRTTLKKRRGEG